jgi:hypothetical protein
MQRAARYCSKNVFQVLERGRVVPRVEGALVEVQAWTAKRLGCIECGVKATGFSNTSNTRLQ